jgi:serine/threonine-protein kinase HipA
MKTAPVWVWLPGEPTPVQAGAFSFEGERGSRGRFRYEKSYLAHDKKVALDPLALPLEPREAVETEQDGIFGAFLDSGPDAWGLRVLEIQLGYEPEPLEALLKSRGDGAGNIVLGDVARVPQVHSSHADLEEVGELFEHLQARPHDLPEILKKYGLEKLDTSLGGMKPKLTIELEGELWIAKFPERNDPRFSIEREYAALIGARRVGLMVCDARLARLKDKSALLVKRFDRERIADGKFARLGYASANTVMRLKRVPQDGRKSYLAFSEELAKWCADQKHNAVEDQRELWRRVVFNAVVGNIDDHTKNHALIMTRVGWRLSPAFDIVPPRTAPVLTQAMPYWLDAAGNLRSDVSVTGLLASINRYGFGSRPEANEIAMPELGRILTGVREGWRDWMKEAGLPPEEIEHIKPVLARCEKLLKELDTYVPPQPSPRELRRLRAKARGARAKTRA